MNRNTVRHSKQETNTYGHDMGLLAGVKTLICGMKLVQSVVGRKIKRWVLPVGDTLVVDIMWCI